MSDDDHASSPAGALAHALEHARHLLPQQGPIAVFVHHNTLHAFEHLPFGEAVDEARRALGGRGFLPEPRFREMLATGRITERDLDAALDPGGDEELVGGLVTRRALRKLSLRHGLPTPTRSEATFLVKDGDALTRFREGVSRDCQEDVLCERSTFDALGALYAICTRLVPEREQPRAEEPPRRHRDALLARTGVDTDHLTRAPLIRWASAFLDDGVAYWPMPHRGEGLFRAVVQLEARAGVSRPAWAEEAGRWFRRFSEAGTHAPAACLELLAALGVPQARWPEHVASTLLAVRGWAGMMAVLETAPESHPLAGPARLVDFLAVQLVFELSAARHVAAAHRLETALGAMLVEVPAELRRPDRPSDAFTLFALYQHLGVSAERAKALGAPVALALLEEVARFDERARLRVWQEAYEWHFQRAALESLVALPAPSDEEPGTPRLQVVTCIDDREESFRRALEEAAPDTETLGAAGFFGLPVDFRGIDDAHASPHCPAVVTPEREIREVPLTEDTAALDARRRRKRLFAALQRNVGVGSRLFVRGTLINALVGWLAVVPMAARVFAPRVFAKLGSWWSERVYPKPRTRLLTDASLAEDEGARLGLPVGEQIERVASVLEGMGLRDRFAPLVVLLGHGATTLNNPHASAYHCGACGGRRGGQNARLFAHLANDPDVRAGLAARGVRVPPGTHFVGGEHDTCSDAVWLWDTERVPSHLAPLLEHATRTLDAARLANAHERCRRFDFAPRDMTPSRALAEVERRAFAYDEPRPEYNHATNALAVVGRRSRTRGLFLDRRAFLVSYDPGADPSGDVLARTLAAAGPVAAGINLEYYFSTVDNEVYGSGTKLPHNLAAGLGVVNGAGSDLRTGLCAQMVEVHEPMRLLVVVEAAPQRLLDVLHRLPALLRLVRNAWIRVASLEPDEARVRVLGTDLTFGPPILPGATHLEVHGSSVDYYRGKRRPLGPARILQGATGSAP